MSQKWQDKTNFKEANKKIVFYAKKLRQDPKINLDLEQPLLNFCYVNYDNDIINKLSKGKFKSNSITSIYETRKDQSKEDIEKRKSILRLLSIANKAHYFLFEEKQVWGAPHYIEYPNFINPKKSDFLYEVIYPLYNDCIIIASEWASENKTESAPDNFYNFIRFPVVISKNSMNWLRAKEWERYKIKTKREDKKITQLASAYYKPVTIESMEELKYYKENSAYIIEITDKNIHKYKQKEHICRSCNGIKIKLFNNKRIQAAYYYWPEGWDEKMLQEYIKYYFEAIESKDKNKKKQIPPIVDWIGLP